MKTDYGNLSSFEMSAVIVAIVGVSLIAFQFFTILSPATQSEILAAASVLDMGEAYKAQVQVNEYIFGGIEEFYDQFYIAFLQISEPVYDQTIQVVQNVKNAGHSIASYSDVLAGSYQSNYYGYSLEGEDTSIGGQVMGAFIHLTE